MTQYNRIKFTLIWDKLNDPAFTTIRSWNRGKEEYYKSHIGQRFTVLKIERAYQQTPGSLICRAWLKDVTVVNPSFLPASLVQRDVTIEGKVDQAWCEKILGMRKALLLTFDKSPVSTQKKLETDPLGLVVAA